MNATKMQNLPLTKLLKLYTKRIVKLRHGDQPEKAKMWGQQGKQQPFHEPSAKLQDVA